MIRALRMSAGGGITGLAIAALAAPAAAQTFPADDSPAWAAFECGDAPASDPRGDVPDFDGEEDVVGDASQPAVHRAIDDAYLYLRLRVDAVADLEVAVGAWAFAFDLDADVTDYEVLLVAEALDDSPIVELFRNTETTIPDSPRDPAELSAGTFDFDLHTRIVAAPSSIGGPDGFIAVAVPLSALAPLGITPETELRMWAGSTRTSNLIDGDLACHDAAGSGDAPPLSGSESDPATVDPDGGGDDDPGSDDPGSDDDGGDDGPRLEGGGGCTAASGASMAIPLLAALALRPRRRRA